MQPFIPLDFDNSMELRALCEDLDLVPEFFCTKEMLNFWRNTLSKPLHRDLNEVEKRISKEYYENLIISMRKKRYNKKLDGENDRLLYLNFPD